jgi:hypothetical protein
MRLLLDEHLDRRLKRYFGEEHEVVIVREGLGQQGKR